MARPRSKAAGGYRLTVDGLSFIREDGTRGRVEGKDRVFAASDLEPECVARGLESGALEHADADVAAEPGPSENGADDTAEPAADAEPDTEPDTDVDG